MSSAAGEKKSFFIDPAVELAFKRLTTRIADLERKVEEQQRVMDYLGLPGKVPPRHG